MIVQIFYDKLDEELTNIVRIIKRIPLVTDLIFVKGNELAIYVDGIRIWDRSKGNVSLVNESIYEIGIINIIREFKLPASS